MSELSIRQFLDLSTAHLDKPSKEWLSHEAESDSSTYGGHYGWFAWAHRDPDNPGHTTFGGEDPRCPATLARIFEFACNNGCEYVLFDSDADSIDELPIFDW